MSEPRPSEQYHTATDEVQDAMQMLGKGYEHPSVTIEPAHTVMERRGNEFKEIIIPAFVKISTSFKDELAKIDEISLKVWLYIALSVNRYSGKANPGLRTISEGTGLAVNTIQAALKRLENDYKLLTVDRESRKYNIYEPVAFVSANRSEPVSPDDTDEKSVSVEPQSVSAKPESVSVGGKSVSARVILNQSNQINQIEPERSKEKDSKTSRLKDSTKQEILARGDIAFGISAGLSNEELAAMNERIRFAKEATDCFEREFAFAPLPWDKDAKWMRFKKFVVEEYKKDRGSFRYFTSKRKNEGQFTRLPSNTRIYSDPDLLIAIWPSLKTQPETTKGEHLL